MMKLSLVVIICPLMFTIGCDSDRPAAQYPNKLEISYSASLALSSFASNLHEFVTGNFSEKDNISVIDATIEAGNQTVHIIFLDRNQGDIVGDLMHIRFASEDIEVNDEVLSEDVFIERILRYRRAAELTESIPLIMVSFSDSCTVSQFVRRLSLVAEHGITHLIF